MFKDWAQVKACYKREQNCSITQITNYENDLPYQHQIAIFGASELCDVEVVELVDKPAHYENETLDLADDLVRQVDIFNLRRLFIFIHHCV